MRIGGPYIACALGCVLTIGCGREARIADDTRLAPPSGPLSDARFDAFGDPLEDGVIARFGTHRLAERVGQVRVLTFSPDGALVAIARHRRLLSEVPSVRVSEVRGGALRFCKDDVEATALAFDGFGGLWASLRACAGRSCQRTSEDLDAEEHSLVRWSLTGSDAFTWDGVARADKLLSAPDGRTVLALGKGITLIDAEGRKARWTSDLVAAEVGFSPGGIVAIALKEDAPSELVTLDAANGEERARVALELGSTYSDLRLSPDGRLVAEAAEAAVFVYDAATGARVAALPPLGLSLRGDAMAFTSDGRFVTARGLPPPTEDPDAPPPQRVRFATLEPRFRAWNVKGWAPAAAPWKDGGERVNPVVAGPGGLLAWAGRAGRVRIGRADGTSEPEMSIYESVSLAGQGDNVVVLAFVDGLPEVLDPRRGTRRALSLPKGMTPLGGSTWRGMPKALASRGSSLWMRPCGSRSGRPATERSSGRSLCPRWRSVRSVRSVGTSTGPAPNGSPWSTASGSSCSTRATARCSAGTRCRRAVVARSWTTDGASR